MALPRVTRKGSRFGVGISKASRPKGSRCVRGAFLL